MKFTESNKDIITLPKYKNCFVYFLIREDEVVYVGQTTHGITRPYSHSDKVFDEVKILYCDENMLDVTEDFYIEKYKPEYNKQRNYEVVWGLQRVRNNIRKTFEMPNYNIPKLKKFLKELNIPTRKDIYTGKDYITFKQYQFVMNYLKEKLK